MDELAAPADNVRAFRTARTDIGSMAVAPSSPRSDNRLALVVMGVSGSGKTTVGEAIARDKNVPFFDGDDFHSPEARAKMTAGIPLTDEDRGPWLDRIGARLADGAGYPEGAIVACSALKRAYRDRLRAIVGPTLRFLFLKGDKALMRSRVAQRKGHFMPASLIDSQFAALESPEGEADVATIPADANLASLADQAFAALSHVSARSHNPR
jgi:gluconokinase